MNCPITLTLAIMTIMAVTMAMTMMEISSTSPMAVITESTEKTASSMRICTSTANNVLGLEPCSSRVSGPSRLSWISVVLLASRNRPPPIRMKSRAVNGSPSSWKSSTSSDMIQAMRNSMTSRPRRAIPSPSRRASSRFFSGRLPERMEINRMLSMPSTISSAVRLNRATQASG